MKYISRSLYSDSEYDCGFSVYTELSNVMDSSDSTVSSSNSSPMIFLTAITKEEDIRGNQDQLCRSSTSPPPLSSLVSTTYNNTNEPCSLCHHSISDQYLLVLDGRPYHPHCLRCSLCECDLSYDSSCFVKDGLILCRADYMAKYRRTCDKCRILLETDDVVMRARDAVFHVHCFSCFICGMPLNVGDVFAMTEHFELFCQVHYDTPLIPRGDETLLSMKRKEDSDEHDEYPEDDHVQHNRSKRMRTSFKHHQLRAMKQYFNLNHNPDAKDLKQLAQKTGLTKRVLQVWFQNARAKFRRSMQGREGSSISPTISGTVTTVLDTQVASSSSNHSSEYQSTSPDHTKEYFEHNSSNISSNNNNN